MDCEISIPFKNWRISKIVVFTGKFKKRIYNTILFLVL